MTRSNSPRSPTSSASATELATTVSWRAGARRSDAPTPIGSRSTIRIWIWRPSRRRKASIAALLLPIFYGLHLGRMKQHHRGARRHSACRVPLTCARRGARSGATGERAGHEGTAGLAGGTSRRGRRVIGGFAVAAARFVPKLVARRSFRRLAARETTEELWPPVPSRAGGPVRVDGAPRRGPRRRRRLPSAGELDRRDLVDVEDPGGAAQLVEDLDRHRPVRRQHHEGRAPPGGLADGHVQDADPGVAEAPCRRGRSSPGGRRCARRPSRPPVAPRRRARPGRRCAAPRRRACRRSSGATTAP